MKKTILSLILLACLSVHGQQKGKATDYKLNNGMKVSSGKLPDSTWLYGASNRFPMVRDWKTSYYTIMLNTDSCSYRLIIDQSKFEKLALLLYQVLNSNGISTELQEIRR